MEELHNLTNIKSDKKLLDKEYDNSLKDEYFNKIVTKLKLDKAYLEKYTSLLEESSLEFRNCSNCKGIVECKNRIKGFAYLPKVVDGSLIFEYKPCRFKRNEIKKIKRGLRRKEIPRYIGTYFRSRKFLLPSSRWQSNK